MATPLYKFLKTAGYSTYVLPSAEQHISSAYQNDNIEMNFSKFVLLDLDLSKSAFDNTAEFNTESLKTITDKGELLVNSLRNYAANHEVTVMESRLNASQLFFNPEENVSVSERVFWKWLRKAGLVEFEAAAPNSEYAEVAEFGVDLNLPEDYFKEYLWRERRSADFSIVSIADTGNEQPDPTDNNTVKRVYDIVFSSETNFKPDDTLIISNNGNINIGIAGGESAPFTVYAISSENAKNDKVSILSSQVLVWNNTAVCTAKLDYKRTVQYIGEIQATDNVQSASSSYTTVNAMIPDQNGQTPDILFRVQSDSNYSPSMQYPILSSQDQPEIIGGEVLSSPIITEVEKYPGDQYAYFDTDQKYVNSAGLEERRSGEYFGVYETSRNAGRVSSAPYVYPEFDGSKLDGITVDFDYTHYTKMNIPSKKSQNFDEFSAQYFNSEPPKDFGFNTVMWYYTVTDNTAGTSGTVSTNLYAVTFLNPVTDGVIESYTKLAATSEQDGISYQLGLNINFNIGSGTEPELYDENKAYSLMSFDLYNNTMRLITQTNELYMKSLQAGLDLQEEVNYIKQLIYTQTDIKDINSRIESLYELLNLYSTMQIADSDTITAETDLSVSPPVVRLSSIDKRYGESVKYTVSNMYMSSTSKVLEKNVAVPKGKDFIISVVNNDQTESVLSGNLKITLNRDLEYKQTCKVVVYPENAKYNKKLDIGIVSEFGDSTAGYTVIKDLNLPIDNNLNTNEEIEAINTRWGSVRDIVPARLYIKKISDTYFVVAEIDEYISGCIKNGDVFMLENFAVKYNDYLTGNPRTEDLSGQYQVTGNVIDSRVSFKVEKSVMENIFRSLTEQNSAQGNSLQAVTADNIIQPPVITYNTGWEIEITATGRSGEVFSDMYYVSVKKK